MKDKTLIKVAAVIIAAFIVFAITVLVVDYNVNKEYYDQLEQRKNNCDHDWHKLKFEASNWGKSVEVDFLKCSKCGKQIEPDI